MPVEHLIDQIRDIAINAKASPLVIDKLDEFFAAPTEEEIEEQISEAVNETWDACCNAIRDLSDDKDIGLTEMQIEQLLDVLHEMQSCT